MAKTKKDFIEWFLSKADTSIPGWAAGELADLAAECIMRAAAVGYVNGMESDSAKCIWVAAMTEERAKEIIHSLRLFAPGPRKLFNVEGLVQH